MKRKLMLLLACLFVGIGLVTAQTQTVTGVVISEEDGQPVIGASVRVENTQLGAITDVDGKFQLEFREDFGNFLHWYGRTKSYNPAQSEGYDEAEYRTFG